MAGHEARGDGAVSVALRLARLLAEELAGERPGRLAEGSVGAASSRERDVVEACIERMCRGDAAWRPDHAWSLSWMTRDRDRLRYWAHALLAPTREEWRWLRLPGAFAWLYPAVRLARLAVRR